MFSHTPRDAEERSRLLVIEGVTPGPDGTVIVSAMALSRVMEVARPEGAVGRGASAAVAAAVARRTGPVVRLSPATLALAPANGRGWALKPPSDDSVP